MIPSQNTGIEMPISARTVMNRSDHRPALTADITPTTIPKKSQIIAGADRQRERRRDALHRSAATTFCWLV